MSKFTHLIFHTEYSLLKSSNKINKSIQRIKELKMNSIAITDSGNMFGAIDFYKTMKKENLKPILGMEAYTYNLIKTGDSEEVSQNYSIHLYAKNMEGYKNMMYLSSQAFGNYSSDTPRITKELLQKNSKGLICILSSFKSEIGFELNRGGGVNIAKERAISYKNIFGDDLYIGLVRNNSFQNINIESDLIAISKELNIKLVATNDIYFTKKDDIEIENTLLKMGGSKFQTIEVDSESYIKSSEEMVELFKDIPESIKATQEISDKCNLEIKLGNPTPPNFKFTLNYADQLDLELPEKDKEFSLENDIKLFTEISKNGLEERLKIVDEEQHQIYKDRLDIEIGIINSMNFPGYMLIVWDFVKASEKKDIPIGPGRGSAAGSLVAFSLKITDIDPMKYDLLFERFLNPERVSMPDIDMDFAQNRRKDIIHYVQDKYGQNNVAQVITYSGMLAKGVLKDVAKVLEIQFKDVSNLTNLIPNELGINLEKAYEMEPKIADFIESDTSFQELWRLALALEGVKKNTGVHAAGVVISNNDLWTKTPIYISQKKGAEKSFITQYSLSYLEDVDLIKFDFLGLKTLDVIYGAKKLIKEHKGIDIDWHQIDIDDSKVYEMMSDGKTVGMFQIESSGMQDLNRRMKPSNFEDVIALIALYRPGPMEAGMLDDFVSRKHGRQKISYPFEEVEFPELLKEILDPTYGVIVYQEQVMQIVQKIGRFSLGRSDIVRRAMGKKQDMTKFKSEFSDGAIENGLDKDLAEKLFVLIEKFAGYGFNKSHSAAYAMITFQTAYLKAHYPAEFLSAMLSTETDNMNKIALYVNEARTMDIEVLAPDIQESQREFSVVERDGKEAILFGLGGIKGVGSSAIDSILEARKDGIFEDIPNFLNRVGGKKVNKGVLSSLIKSGAFNNLKTSETHDIYNRKTLIDGIDLILKFSQKVGELKKKMGEDSLFGDDSEFTKNREDLILNPKEDFSLKEILKLEKETMNFYISGHPLDEFNEKIESMNHLSHVADIGGFKNWQEIVLVVIIEIIQIKVSKNSGKRYAQVKFLDKTGEYPTTFFSHILDKFENLPIDVQEGAIGVKCQVKMEDENNRSIFVKEFFALDEVNQKSKNLKKGNKAKKKVIQEVRDENSSKEYENTTPPAYDCNLNFDKFLTNSQLSEILYLATSFQGDRKLMINIQTSNERIIIDTQKRVSPSFDKAMVENVKI